MEGKQGGELAARARYFRHNRLQKKAELMAAVAAAWTNISLSGLVGVTKTPTATYRAVPDRRRTLTHVTAVQSTQIIEFALQSLLTRVGQQAHTP